MDSSFDFSHWSDSELARAEATAGQFLTENQITISTVFARQCAVLQKMISMLQHDELTIEQRLDCFARISELAGGIERSAKGFFDLGSQPLVARMLAQR